jgi:hypothetical protein
MPNEFKAVEWMRRRREEIDREDEGLNWGEKRDKTRRVVENDSLWRSLPVPSHDPSQAPNFAAGEEQKPYDQ